MTPTIEADIRFAIVPHSIARMPEPREIGSLIRSQRTDAADLNSDRTEIREAAKRERGDREGTRIERLFHRAEALERDEFVRDHAQSQQVADRRRVVPRNSNQPRDRRENPAENLLQTGGKPSNAMKRETLWIPPKHSVHQINQRDKSDQHRPHVEREAQPIGRAAGNAPSMFLSRSISAISTRPAVTGFSVSGTSIFASKIVPGAVMITAASTCFASTPYAM